MNDHRYYPKNAVRICLHEPQQDDFDGTLFSCIRKKGFSFHNFTSFIILTEEILDLLESRNPFRKKERLIRKKIFENREFAYTRGLLLYI